MSSSIFLRISPSSSALSDALLTSAARRIHCSKYVSCFPSSMDSLSVSSCGMAVTAPSSKRDRTFDKSSCNRLSSDTSIIAHLLESIST